VRLSPCEALPVPDGRPRHFEARNRQFLLDGKPLLLVAGEMHFGRVLPEDWELRLRQAKAMGLNTVSFYLFWSLCEPADGRFAFEGLTDVRRMLKLCSELGLWAILRPGPYCCAEYDYGGIPAWTTKYPEVKIRTADPQWLAWSERYFRRLAVEVADLQVSRGGPLLLLQLDNEYVMAAEGDYSYLKRLAEIARVAGFDLPLFTCDPILLPEKWPGQMPAGVLRGRNGLRPARDYANDQKIVGNDPLFVPEVYTSWFSGWGSPLATRHSSTEEIRNWTAQLLEKRISFCYYMFHGGTTFGFYTGANEHLPLVNSYDYAAPVDEAGRTTAKYHALRTLLSERLRLPLPPVPEEPKVIEIPVMRLDRHQALLDFLPEKPALVSEQPVSMETLGQSAGFVLYRKHFPEGLRGRLVLEQASDYTLVIVNGRTLHRAFVGEGLDSNRVDLDVPGPATLDLLVHSLGRISVVTSARSQARARKGLLRPATLDGKALLGWEQYALPLDTVPRIEGRSGRTGGPEFHAAEFHLDELGGTYLDLSHFGFGAVWVNGHNLGRFWNRGALRSLFVPSHWLRKGSNELVVLELLDRPAIMELGGRRSHTEREPVPFKVRLDRATLSGE